MNKIKIINYLYKILEKKKFKNFKRKELQKNIIEIFSNDYNIGS